MAAVVLMASSKKDGAMQRYYRPAYKPSYLSKGDTLAGVRALQEFLKWKVYFTAVQSTIHTAQNRSGCKGIPASQRLKVDGKVELPLSRR